MPKRNVWYFIKRFKRNSVFIRNLLLFLAVMMMPLLMCGYYLSGQITNLLIEQNAASSISAIERIAGGLQNQLAEAEYMTTHAGFCDDIQLFLLSGAEDAVGYEKDIVEYLNTYVSVKKHIDSLYVYSFESEILIDNHNLYRISEFEDTSWLENVKDLEINDSLFIGRKKGAGYLDCITVIKPIYIIPNYMQGAVVCNISIKELSKSFGDIAGVENMYIIQDNGNILYGKDRQSINTQAPKEIQEIIQSSQTQRLVGESYEINSEKKYVSKVSIEDYGIHILSLTPASYYSQKVQNVQKNMFIVLVTLMIVAIVSACYMAFRSFMPIKSIYEIVSDNGSPGDIKQMNEFLMIESNIKKKLAKNEEMDRELKLRIELLKKAQLTALQAQINPHFLYNTLDNLNWLAFQEFGGRNSVSEGLVSLSNLFYESAKDERHVVPLEEELQFTQLYLNIVKMRYGDMVKTEISIPPELYQVPVIKISLQPLIENAIYHGIKPKGKGKVTVSGRLLKDSVEISVEDDGMGMEEEKIAVLNQTLSEEYIEYSGSIGVRNTNQRIKLAFGENYGIKVETSAFGGLKVRVRLPKS